MTRTFLSNLNETVTKLEKDHNDQIPEFTELSKNVIDNILNFSRNLEIKRSRFVDAIEVMKS